MARVCDISGKRTRTGNHVSHANNKTKRKFYPNLQNKRFYLTESGSWLSMRVSTSVMRTINKNGLLPVLKQAHQRGTLSKRLASLVANL